MTYREGEIEMKIREVILQSSNYEAAKRFYCETLQLPLLEEKADSIVIQAGESKLILVANDGGTGFLPPRLHDSRQ